MTGTPTSGPDRSGVGTVDSMNRHLPVLPCVQHTGVSATRLIQPTSPGLPEPQDPGSRRLAVALAVISASQLMVVLDATIVTVALPSIRTALRFSPVSLEWTISAYTLAFGGFLLLGGRLGDVFGRRRMFISGLIVFTVASFAGGLATTSAWLIATRAVQGLGGAITAPTALALIGETFPDGPARTRAMGIYAAMSGAGGAVGLLLGGVLTAALSWRWVLFVNVPVGVLVAVSAPLVLARSARQAGTRLDVPGSVSATAGVTALVYGLVRAPVDGWGDPVTFTAFAVAFVLLVAFVVTEKRSDHPALPFGLLKDRNRSASYIVMFTLGGGIFAVFYFLTLYLQTDEGYSPLKAGLAFLPFSVGIAATSQGVAKLMRRIPPRVFVTVGPFMGSAGLFWLSRLDDHSSYVTGVLGPIIVIAVGLGLTFVPLVLGVTSGVRPAELGIASAVLNTAQQVGGTLGLAVLVTIAADATKNALNAAPATGNPRQIRDLTLAASLHGYTTAFTVGACIALVAFAVALLGARPPAPSGSPTSPSTGTDTAPATEVGTQGGPAA
jgi:EmrB/QacA subfamily drug resistance transporter